MVLMSISQTISMVVWPSNDLLEPDSIGRAVSESDCRVKSTILKLAADARDVVYQMWTLSCVWQAEHHSRLRAY